MTTTAKGRRRHEALFAFLDLYAMATTDQLAALVYNGDRRLARGHLLRFHRDGLLRRLPHPLYRNGCYVYMSRCDRATSHSQKVLHHLQAVDFHLAVTRALARYGARVIPELQWAAGVVPDQTLMRSDSVWAIEHHLSGEFRHAQDYRQMIEDEAHTLCHWWKPGLKLGLLVVTDATFLERVQTQLKRAGTIGIPWRVGTKANVLRDPAAYLK